MYILQMGVLQITQICSVTFNQWWIVANVLNQIFKNFALWHKMDNDMWRLLIVFFLGMFCKLVFCKLQNMRWTRNVTSIICCRGACSAWSKLLKPPYIYGTQWHYVTKKDSSLIKNIISQKWHLTTYTANLHILLLLVFWITRSSTVCRCSSK